MIDKIMTKARRVPRNPLIIAKLILRRLNLLDCRRKATIARTAIVDLEARILNIPAKKNDIIVGEGSHICGVLALMDGQGRIEIGADSFIGPGTRIWSWGKISIGKRVMISHNCNIFDSMTHPYSPSLRATQFRAITGRCEMPKIDLGVKDVSIGDDAWIACGVTILRGVEIGCRSIVAAGSVVTKNVPSNVIVAGNPAKIIKCLNESDLK